MRAESRGKREKNIFFYDFGLKKTFEKIILTSFPLLCTDKSYEY